MDRNKLAFLQNDFIFLLRHLGPEETGKWGKMNGQQMVEHFTDAVKNASGKLTIPLQYEGEKLARFREFLMSEKPFLENTKNPLLNEEPSPVKHTTLQNAISELQLELDYLVQQFEGNPDFKSINPFFGELNSDQIVRLLHKHATHHLAQFGLTEKMRSLDRSK